jgi:hypothetical protein
MAIQIQLRRGTAAAWTSANPTLAAGELVIETDTDKYKIGDGSTAWTSLGYSSLPSTAIANTVVDAKGDIVAATAADTVSRLAVGTDTYVLTADSGEATGLIWAAPTTGDITAVVAGTNIGGGATGGSATVNLAIDAAVDMGTDGSGVDVTFHSATAGDNMLWDASDEKLVITGTDGQNSLEVADGDVEITDQLTVSGGLVAPLQINAQTGTTYTFVLADAGKMVTSSNGSAQTLTVPPNSSVAYATGTQIIVQAIGSGTATLAEGSGVTINSKDSNKEIDGQWAAATLIKTATDTWSLIGALA